MEQAKEAVIVKQIFKDEGQFGAGDARVLPAVIDEEPLLDEKGKQITDPDTKQPVVRRTITYQQVAGPKGGDACDKMMENMGKMAMMNMLMKSTAWMEAGGVAGPYGAFPLQEPILDEQGKPVLDQFGRPMMKTTGYWSPMMVQPQQGGTKTSEAVEVVKAVAEVMKPQANTGESKIVDTLLATVKERDSQAMADLRQSIRELQGNDPFSYAVEMVGKLKGLGIMGGEKNPENLEVAKIDLDFKKWAKTHDDELTRWIWEQKQKQADQKYAREQLTELGKTVREGIEKVGKPLAEGFGDGFKHGVARSGAPQQGPRQAQESHEKTVKDMSPEELSEYLAKAQQAEKVVETAKNNVIAEMQARGLPA